MLKKLASIPFGEYAPDMPDVTDGGMPHPGLVTCTNAHPATPQSYHSVGDFAAISGALGGGRCRGVFAATDSDGTVHIFAGTNTTLERLTVSSVNWSDVSISGGYDTVDEFWDAMQFDRRVIKTNFRNNPQSFVLGTSTLFANLFTAFRARYCALVRGGFPMFANTFDATDGNQPQGVWWTARNDPTNVPTPGTAAAAAVLSGRVTLRGDGGWNQRVFPSLGAIDVVVLQERAVWRGMYVGLPDVFEFERVQGAIGTPAPWSAVQVGNVLFYLTEHGFVAFNGVETFNIGANKVDRNFWNRVDLTYLSYMSAAWNPIHKHVIWSWSTSGATPNVEFCFAPHLQKWGEGAIDLTRIGRGLGMGYTLDQLDTINTSIDALPFSLDSRAWQSNRGQLVGFNSSNVMGTMTGANRAVTLITAERDIGAGRRVRVQATRPLVDGGTITTRLGYRNTPQDTVNYSAAVSAGADGLHRHMVEDRFIRARIDVAAGGTTTRNLKGIEVYGKPAGMR